MTITLSVTGGSSVTPTLGQPTLTLDPASDTGDSSTDNLTNVSTPMTFNAVFPDGLVGDTVDLYDGSTLLGSVVLSTGAAFFADVTFTAGTHDPKIKYHRDGGTITSAKSDSLSPLLIIDQTAPTISITGVKTGETTGSITPTTDTASGRYFWIVDNNLTTPSADQVIAGLAEDGGAAAKSGYIDPTTTGAQSAIGQTGLSSATNFKAFACHRDVSHNKSTVAASSTFTTDSPTQVVASGWWTDVPFHRNPPTYSQSRAFEAGWAFVFFQGNANSLNSITFDGAAADAYYHYDTPAFCGVAAKYFGSAGTRTITANLAGGMALAFVGCTINGATGITGTPSGPTHTGGASDPQAFAGQSLSSGDLGMAIISTFTVASAMPAVWNGVTTPNVASDGFWIDVALITGTWGSVTAAAAGSVDFDDAAFGTFKTSLKWSL